MKTVLTKSQVKVYQREVRADIKGRGGRPGERWFVMAKARHDDACENGHNTFAITAWVYSSACPNSRDGGVINSEGKRRGLISCGCQHEIVAQLFPQLAPLVKWHLSDAEGGPMGYKANALYHAGLCPKYLGQPGETYPANWEYFKGHVVFGAVETDPADISVIQSMTKAELSTWLDARLPSLMAEFQKAVESIGLVF